ncbi:Aste57867_16357 [Aphanomyces stellatus]|uniref:Aste57867_16357 protein n=1 Tax=Aphanomyces stellatus TaxID=120398 RepID=A0A485L6H4_9STRA|nr:hypothetical protein As57867_016300 [Aphanomyces stellatus]VFT93133.1 Aste57867_16357 [Aphanomyces stellatus]
MADLDLDDLDEHELLPEDDDMLSYFLGGAVEGPIKDLLMSVPPPRTTSFGTQPPHMGQSTAGGLPQTVATPNGKSMTKRSVDTSSNGSNEFDGPESPTGDDIDVGTEDDRRRKRLERNRESARQSRRRKKQYLELLEGKVSQLTDEIEAARGEHLNGADSTLKALKAQLVASLFDKIAPYPPNVQLTAGISDELRNTNNLIQERFGPNSQERQAVVNYHFQQLDSLLLPPYTRFLLWMSVQDEAFYAKSAPTPTSKRPSDVERKDSVAKKDGLWSALSTELGLTYEQEEKIKGHYCSGDSKTAKLERRKIAMAVSYLNQLKQNMAERSAAVQSHADSIQSILTPEQTVRYQQWAIENRDTYGAGLKSKSLQFANAPAVDPSAKISTILRKPDQALTVEDVTSLLATLSKPTSRT